MSARSHDFVVAPRTPTSTTSHFIHGPPPKVIWLRVVNASTDRIAKLLAAGTDVVSSFEANEQDAVLVLRLGARHCQERRPITNARIGESARSSPLGEALQRGRDCPAVDAQRWELPDDLPLVERQVVRLVVLDTASQVLLFHTHDPTYPELGVWWELPGGGLEADETYAEAAVRELHEETGIGVTEAQVDAPTWQRHATFRYRGERRLQHEVVVTVQLASEAPSVDSALRVGYEDEDYFAYRWWAVDQIGGSSERFYPGRLPELISVHLRGETIHEPFEVWS